MSRFSVLRFFGSSVRRLFGKDFDVAQLVIIGTHQRNCPVAVRERLAFDMASLQPALRSLRDHLES